MKIFNLSHEEEERALEIHHKSIVIDASVDPDISEAPDKYYERMMSGGITAQNATAPSGATADVAIHNWCYWKNWIKRSGNKLLLAKTAEDIEKAKKEGKGAIIFGPQNVTFIGNELCLLTLFHKLGIRIIQLTYNKRNLVGYGCLEKMDFGLSNFGVKLVEEMDKLGILIDLSHCGDKTAMEAIELSKNPVVFSHAHPSSLFNNPRNKTDEHIKAIAESGGVIGLTTISDFMVAKDFRPTLEDFLNHINYVVDLVGVDHVGIGSDISYNETKPVWIAFATKYPYVRLDYETRYVEGLESIEFIPNITRGLVAKGYSDQEINKILGSNFLRVFRKVWGK